MLYAVDQPCRQARPECSTLPFGGMNVLLAGDPAQLPPVGDLASYSTRGKCSRQQAAGRLLYEQFTESYILTDSMRQAGSQNSEFRDQLNRLSNGTFTKEDWLAWRKRSLSKLDPSTQKLFEESGTKLCALKVDMKTFNMSGLERTGMPLLVIHSKNSSGAASFPSDRAGNIQNMIPIAKTCKVVLTENLWPDAKLFNGSQGFVRYIIFPEGTRHATDMPAFLICHFPGYLGHAFLPGEEGTVPIFPVRKEWYDQKKLYSRTGYPLLLGYSLTIHKSQGMTMNKVITNLGPREFANGLAYTGSSRVPEIESMAFDPMPNLSRFTEFFETTSFKQMLAEKKKKMTRVSNRKL